ncbi:MAG: hypothetical protein KAX44_07455 [Candidatus Brocadiae bacterium]|nr:hypothetical protein [Candidatus Brocadiia bacterium]
MAKPLTEFDIQIAFSEVRLQLMAIATRHPDELQAMVAIGDILARLQPVCRPLATGHPEPPPTTLAAKPRGHAGSYGRQKLYYRVISVRGLCLAEDWKQAKQPYYVPMAIYEQAAEVLASSAAAGPVPFERLSEDLDRLISGASAYMLRACLRFWRQADPPLVTMTQRRYLVESPETFRQEAMRLWEATPTLAG